MSDCCQERYVRLRNSKERVDQRIDGKVQVGRLSSPSRVKKNLTRRHRRCFCPVPQIRGAARRQQIFPCDHRHYQRIEQSRAYFRAHRRCRRWQCGHRRTACPGSRAAAAAASLQSRSGLFLWHTTRSHRGWRRGSLVSRPAGKPSSRGRAAGPRGVNRTC